MGTVERILCAGLLTLAFLSVTSGHVHGDAPRKYLGKADTLAAIREARIDIHAHNPLLGDGMSSWSPLDLPPDRLMNIVVTFIEEIDALANDTSPSPTPIDRLTDVLGSLVIFVRNVRMALDSNGDSSTCDTCLVIAKFLKAASLVLEWEQAAPIVSRLCVPIVQASVGTPENAEELCKITDIQGPAMYAALIDVSVLPRTHCIYYENRCPGPYSESTDLWEGLPTDSNLPTLPLLIPRPTLPMGRGRRSGGRRRRSLEDAVKVIQTTDIHTDLTYTVGNEAECGLPVCCYEELGPGSSPAGKWAHYNCNPPQWTVDLMLQKAFSLGPDFMLYSGDTPSNVMWRETFEGQMNCSRALTESIARNMPGMPAFPAIGNHETYPGNQYYGALPETRMMNQHFLDWWGPLAGFDGDNNITMLESGYFAKEVKPGLVVLSFNIMYGFPHNWYAPMANAEVPASKNYVKVMKKWTLETMDAARARGDKVIFMSHVIAGGGTWMHTRWVTNLLVQYSDIVVLHVAGDNHRDDFRVIRDPVTYEPKGLGLISGAISPQDKKNPGFRLFYLDPDTFEVMDYDQYYMDVEANFDAELPSIDLAYRASEEYGLAAITGEEYDKLITRMENDPSIYNKYIVNHYTRVPGTNPNTCGTHACMYNRLCRLSYANADNSAACTRREIPISPMVPTTTTLPPCATQFTTTTTTTTTDPNDTSGADQPYRFLSTATVLIAMAFKLTL